MPARRRAQEAKRRACRLASVVSPTPAWEPTEDQVWEEHQAYERHRRSPMPLDEVARREERRHRTWRAVLAAKQTVERDLARWRRETT